MSKIICSVTMLIQNFKNYFQEKNSKTKFAKFEAKLFNMSAINVFNLKEKNYVDI